MEGTTRDYKLSQGNSTSPTTRCAKYVERISLNTKYSVKSALSNFHSLFRCRVFDVPSDFLENVTSLTNMFYQSFNEYIDLTHIDFTLISSSIPLTNTFLQSGNVKLGNVNNLTNTFNLSNVESIGDVTTNLNSLASVFNQTRILREIGLITSPLVNNIQSTFNRSSVEEVVFDDSSLISITTNTFLNAFKLRKLIMPGLTVGISINSCAFQAQELDDFFTSLGTASGSPVIDVKDNPGSATCDTTIATSKGFTVTIA